MSPSDRSPDDPATTEAYASRLIARLGDRDPLALMSDLLPTLRELVSGLSLEELCAPEAEGKWSVLDVVVHLLDSEVVYGYRMRYIVAEPGRDLASYDQDRWARALRYEDARLDLALDALEALRRWNLDWLAALAPDERERWGTHGERGRESVDRIVQLLAAHDMVHLEQVRRILQASS